MGDLGKLTQGLFDLQRAPERLAQGDARQTPGLHRNVALVQPRNNSLPMNGHEHKARDKDGGRGGGGREGRATAFRVAAGTVR